LNTRNAPERKANYAKMAKHRARARGHKPLAGKRFWLSVGMLRRIFFHCFFAKACSQRALHWTIRVSDLATTLNFTTTVLGMKTLRHEENDQPCPISSNGAFDTPWSKTMVGYGREDASYALKLTYNYGVQSYKKGGGLNEFRIILDGVSERSDAAFALGYHVEYRARGVRHIIGPDGYEFTLVPDHHGNGGKNRDEPFSTVVLRSNDPAKLSYFYKQFLGMKELMHKALDPKNTIDVVGYEESKMRFVIATALEAPKITQWAGRNAIAMPEAAVRDLNMRVLKEAPHLILHELRVLEETHGPVVVLVLRDPAGYEVCIVSSEHFDRSVAAATDYKGPNWEHRASLLDEHILGAKDEL
jgi:lactoylglutathione lyase